MKRSIFTLIIILQAFNLCSQNMQQKRINNKPIYSGDSEIRVINNTKSIYQNQSPIGIFVNGNFIGNQSSLDFINSNKIETLKVEKKSFEKNGTTYNGKILLEMKSGYKSNFITLKSLTEKHLTLDKNPTLYQINEKVLESNKTEFLIDENFILKIIPTKIKTSNNKIEINLIQIITKTADNIKKANEIRIKGNKN
ncbi:MULTISPECIES: hypothetical protein [unclassified Tenacibaculum]|uniref:hypothetical protein n=1 Tax=unclassified Tenacibaculum TaxID=2635139 RepID=UPI001F237917|nr:MULTISPECIES: hypothetical protein [unclassified Tenacibaculum]MCF2874764.1 hypothetical protein [Tenacibaculum sp. Cn5-1]MCF2934170.1 hypothetical protein [Tenacibaculum sp. Cn5-34]MCG7510380.1 hypothetical protein [Tenacibaculum sp. Cn5-46]